MSNNYEEYKKILDKCLPHIINKTKTPTYGALLVLQGVPDIWDDFLLACLFRFLDGILFNVDMTEFEKKVSIEELEKELRDGPKEDKLSKELIKYTLKEDFDIKTLYNEEYSKKFEKHYSKDLGYWSQ